MAHKHEPPIRVEFSYDFGKKEFMLRFERHGQAAAYQTKNPEARIFFDQPYNVWLPPAPGMSGLRHSSLGMVLDFESPKAAEKWQERTVLGTVVTSGNMNAGVYFKRDWSPADLEGKLGPWKSNLGPPKRSSAAVSPARSDHNIFHASSSKESGRGFRIETARPQLSSASAEDFW